MEKECLHEFFESLIVYRISHVDAKNLDLLYKYCVCMKLIGHIIRSWIDNING